MIPPQHIVVTCSPAEDVAGYWQHCTEAAPDLVAVAGIIGVVGRWLVVDCLRDRPRDVAGAVLITALCLCLALTIITGWGIVLSSIFESFP